MLDTAHGNARRRLLLVLAVGFTIGMPSISHALETQPAKTSKLTGYELPVGTMRVATSSTPADALKLLQTLVKNSGVQLPRGQTEVMAWSGGDYSKASAAELMAEVAATLSGAGWRYEANEEQGEGLIPFTATRSAEKKIVGYWAPTEDALILVWTVLSAKKPATKPLELLPEEILLVVARQVFKHQDGSEGILELCSGVQAEVSGSLRSTRNGGKLRSTTNHSNATRLLPNHRPDCRTPRAITSSPASSPSSSSKPIGLLLVLTTSLSKESSIKPPYNLHSKNFSRSKPI